MKKILLIIFSIILSFNAYSQCAGVSATGTAKAKVYKSCYDTVVVASQLNTVKADTVEVARLTVTNLTDGLVKSVSDVLTPAVEGTDYITTGSTSTLTNKTLTSPIINLGSDATGDIYYRNGSGVFARLPIGSNGEVLTLSGGAPSWVAPSGGVATIPIYFSLSGQANSTIGMLAKASGDVTTNPSGKPTTNPYTSHVNGGSDPYPIKTGGSIANVTLAISSCAVAQGTVGANPTLRLDVYKEAVGGRVLVDSIDVPIPAAKVGVSNTLGADNYIVVSYDLPSPIAVGGEGIGMQFTNRSADNEEINAISRLTVTAYIEF